MKRFILICGTILISCLLPMARAGATPKSMGDLVFPEGTPSDVKGLLPNELHFPRNYVSRLDTAQGEAVRLVGTEDDINSVLKEMTYEEIRDGIFTLVMSNEVGFDATANKFSGEGESRSTEQLEEAGFRDIRFTRSNPANVPTLELTCRRKDQEIFLLYVSVGKTGSVLKISYHHPKVLREADTVIWRTFVDGLSKAN